MKDELEVKVVYTRDAPTRCEGRRYQIAPGDTIRFPARQAPYHRKQFIISNRDTALNLQLRVSSIAEHADPAQTPLTGSDAGALAVTIFKLSNIGIFTSDAIYVKNANASGTIECDILETWYS